MMSLTTIAISVIVIVVLDGVQMAHSFRWISLMSKRSPPSWPMTPLPTMTSGGNHWRTGAGEWCDTALEAHAPKPETEPETMIDYQSDAYYGRGDMHLSAAVHEGETVVYRTGSWYVDGVMVGDEDAVPAYELCRIETIQIVWTHNCEHGVLRGLAVDSNSLPDQEEAQEESRARAQNQAQAQNQSGTKTRLSLRTPLEDVQFGPEQIIANIRNVVWEPTHPGDGDDDVESESDEETGFCSIQLHPSMWEEHDANNNDAN